MCVCVRVCACECVSVQVGRALTSPEPLAAATLASLDVDYVLVVFGGVSGFPSDDINKMVWMLRSAATAFPSLTEAPFRSPRVRAPSLLRMSERV